MRAKKSLGQHFLKSKNVLGLIIKAADISPTDTVLEVGPGKGVLTEALLEKAGRVIAVEKDDRLIDVLKQKFRNELLQKRFTLIHEDILRFNPSDYKLKTNNYKLVANIPYYITGALFKKFLSGESPARTGPPSGGPPSRMVLLVQKEVAERIVARDGKESILSISVKAYGKPRYVATVGKKNFSPAPAVDSAILLIEAISRSFFDDIDEDDFFALVKTGFSRKRKFVMNNVKKLLPQSAAICKQAGIPSKARAEDLSLQNWKDMLINADAF